MSDDPDLAIDGDEPAGYKCEKCDETFDKSAKLRNHRYRVHGGGTKEAECPGCHKLMPKGALSNHKNRCSSLPVGCVLCGVTLKNGRSHTEHLKSKAHHARVNTVQVVPRVIVQIGGAGAAGLARAPFSASVVPAHQAGAFDHAYAAGGAMGGAARAAAAPPAGDRHDDDDEQSLGFGNHGGGGDNWLFEGDGELGPPPIVAVGHAAAPLVSCTLESFFGYDKVLEVFKSVVFHTRFVAKVSRAAKDRPSLQTCAQRTQLGLRAFNHYIADLESKVDVNADVRNFTMGDNSIALEMGCALLASSHASASSPAAFFSVRRESNAAMRELLEKLSLSASSAHQAFAFIAGLARWLKEAAQAEVQHERGVAALQRHDLLYQSFLAFCDELLASVLAVSPMLTRYKEANKKTKSRYQCEISTGASLHAESFCRTYGDVVHAMMVEVDSLVAIKDENPDMQQLLDINDRAWLLIAMMLCGAGSFSFRPGVFTCDDLHTFVVAESQAMFNSVRGNKSGLFRDDHDNQWFVIVSPQGRQKDWLVGEPTLLPPLAHAIIVKIINNQLLDGVHVFHPALFIKRGYLDNKIAAFQTRFNISVPLLLVGTAVAEKSSERKKAARELSAIAQQQQNRRYEALRARVDDDDDVDDKGEDDDEDDDEDEGQDEDDDGADDGTEPEPVETGKLCARVLRRLLTTVIQYLYMQQLIDEHQLSAATYLNLHSLDVAKTEYNRIGSMFIELDSMKFARWKLASKISSGFSLKAQGAASHARGLNPAVCSWDQLVQWAHEVHDTALLHAKFYSMAWPEKDCPECGFPLAGRMRVSDPRFHSCQTKRRDLINKFKREHDDK